MNLIPTVIETTNRGERAYDIYSRLLKDRIIMLGSQIDDNVANSIVSQLLFLQAQDSEKTSTYISIHQVVVLQQVLLFMIQFNILNRMFKNLYWYGSIYGIILISSRAKQRFALPNAEVMIHQPLGGAQVKRLKSKLLQTIS